MGGKHRFEIRGHSSEYDGSTLTIILDDDGLTDTMSVSPRAKEDVEFRLTPTAYADTLRSLLQNEYYTEVPIPPLIDFARDLVELL